MHVEETLRQREQDTGEFVKESLFKQAQSAQQLGIAHSRGVTVLFSASPNLTFGQLETQGAASARTPRGVDEKIRERQATNERRKFLVIVEGDLGWLRTYQSGVREADIIVYVSSEETLERFGVEIVDKQWGKGKAPFTTIDQFFRHFLPGVSLTLAYRVTLFAEPLLDVIRSS